MSGKKR